MAKYGQREMLKMRSIEKRIEARSANETISSYMGYEFSCFCLVRMCSTNVKTSQQQQYLDYMHLASSETACGSSTSQYGVE
jgi:hypothetical protein